MAKEQNAPDTICYIQQCIKNLQSQNPRQRSHAAQELGKLRDVAAVPHLICALKQDVNTYVRSASAEALGHIGDAQAVFPLMDSLHDSCTFVRRAAAISLGQMQAKTAQGALLRALDDPNFYVRRAAINAIGKLGVPDLGSVLLPLLDTPDPRIRRTVITALRRLRTAEAIPAMIDMLETYVVSPSQRDLPIVKTLVAALGDLHAEAAVPVLMRVVRGYVGGRSLSATALGKIGDAQAGEVLVEALSAVSVNLQLAALKSLGKIHYTPAVADVRKFLDSPDSRLRRTAVITLGHLEDKAIIPELLKIANEDISPLVRPAAVETLGLLGDADIIPALLPLADDANAFLRAALAQTLSALDGSTPQVQATLKQLSQDKVEHVAMAAKTALETCESHQTDSTHKAIGSEKTPIPWLKRLLKRA